METYGGRGLLIGENALLTLLQLDDTYFLSKTTVLFSLDIFFLFINFEWDFKGEK